MRGWENERRDGRVDGLMTGWMNGNKSVSVLVDDSVKGLDGWMN